MRGERIGVRGGWSAERGKHGEDSDYAGGRNKGESGGGSASGAWRKTHWGTGASYRGGVNSTVFVDNLPKSVTKRKLYKEFGLHGYVTDIISRKEMLKMKGPFAFIKFQRVDGVLRAIRCMNGSLWGGRRLFMSLSKFRRKDGEKNRTDANGHERRMQPIIKKKWVMVRKIAANDAVKSGDEGTADGKEVKRKKEVDVV
ncbi:hypothetical protein PIB30_008945 [Stylosanthes scabra]|uniref:RRM domain-containing protein n=1 Tax=Stylosanthes scabra TaxID=79078 RepID=A0ABU6R5I3_9FABA|nr:hypothetical protein [Stylosanthes scabra]